MVKTLKIAALALASLAALAAVPAKADNDYLRFSDGDGRFDIYVGDGIRTVHSRRRHDDDDRDEYRWSVRRCTPDRALYKAQRIGVRRARIDYVSQREIGVVGR